MAATVPTPLAFSRCFFGSWQASDAGSYLRHPDCGPVVGTLTWSRVSAISCIAVVPAGSAGGCCRQCGSLMPGRVPAVHAHASLHQQRLRRWQPPSCAQQRDEREAPTCCSCGDTHDAVDVAHACQVSPPNDNSACKPLRSCLPAPQAAPAEPTRRSFGRQAGQLRRGLPAPLRPCPLLSVLTSHAIGYISCIAPRGREPLGMPTAGGPKPH